jgi:hypothetical protein
VQAVYANTAILDATASLIDSLIQGKADKFKAKVDAKAEILSTIVDSTIKLKAKSAPTTALVTTVVPQKPYDFAVPDDFSQGLCLGE